MLKHISVLKDESIIALKIKPNGVYVDATLGGAGHSEAILNELSQSGKLFAFDQDDYAINRAQPLLIKYSNFKIIHANFSQLKEKLSQAGVTQVDGILFDLGLSSFQIDDKERGFSYMADHELDMRMDRSKPLTAKEIINTATLEELTKMFSLYGEEKNAYYIAKEIIKQRPLETTHDLVKITDKINYKVPGHSAKRVFQALRIAVNRELEVLEEALKQALDLLAPKGRLAVITFHSLEDKIVKHFIKEYSTHNLPKNLPLINIPQTKLTNIARKPILPGQNEIELNSRSRSAKLRVAEKN